MNFHKNPQRPDGVGLWLEYVLIIILVILVLNITVALFGPYLKTVIERELPDLCTQFTFLCP